MLYSTFLKERCSVFLQSKLQHWRKKRVPLDLMTLFFWKIYRILWKNKLLRSFRIKLHYFNRKEPYTDAEFTRNYVFFWEWPMLIRQLFKYYVNQLYLKSQADWRKSPRKKVISRASKIIFWKLLLFDLSLTKFKTNMNNLKFCQTGILNHFNQATWSMG